MGLNTFTAALLLVAGAIQADAFAVAPVTAGRPTPSPSQVSARSDVFKLNLSPYEEYMAKRGQTVNAPPAPSAPAPAPASAPARASRPSSGSKWSPRPDWKTSKAPSAKTSYAKVSDPRGSRASAPSKPAAPSYSPPAPAPSARAPAPEPGGKHVGTGGMADTRDPAPLKHEDPRKSIAAAPTFEEYLKSKRN